MLRLALAALLLTAATVTFSQLTAAYCSGTSQAQREARARGQC
jgi:hypothetical protein